MTQQAATASSSVIGGMPQGLFNLGVPSIGTSSAPSTGIPPKTLADRFDFSIVGPIYRMHPILDTPLFKIL